MLVGEGKHLLVILAVECCEVAVQALPGERRISDDLARLAHRLPLDYPRPRPLIAFVRPWRRRGFDVTPQDEAVSRSLPHEEEGSSLGLVNGTLIGRLISLQCHIGRIVSCVQVHVKYIVRCEVTKLRELRKARGWTAFELAIKSHVQPSDISGLENGRRVPPPKSAALRRLARALNYEGDPADLLQEDGDDPQA